jgi:hypothetical protein
VRSSLILPSALCITTWPLPIERIESLRSALHFRVPLGDGAHELEVLR